MERKRYKCTICKEPYLKSTTTQVVCGYKCALEHAKLSKIKKEKTEEKASKAENKRQLQVLNYSKRGYVEGLLQSEINKIVREIDKGHFCISCDVKKAKWDAGHHHSVGSNGALRYHLLNNWKQCSQCNRRKGANIHEYDFRLIDMFGKEQWEYLKFTIVKEIRVRKTPLIDYPRLIEVAREVLKVAKELPPNLTPQQRWDAREKLNLMTQIYPETKPTQYYLESI